jgi:hypothetical protein
VIPTATFGRHTKAENKQGMNMTTTDTTRVPKLTDEELKVLNIMFSAERGLTTNELAYEIFRPAPDDQGCTVVTAEQAEYTERILQALRDHGLIDGCERWTTEH